jgi:hypothetical protein
MTAIIVLSDWVSNLHKNSVALSGTFSQMNFLKNTLLILFLIILLLPAIQSNYHPVREEKLNGFFILNDPPELKKFTWSRWFEGSFQDMYSKGTEDHIGLRKSLFRLHNQYDYSLFGITHALGFIKGKNNHLFEEDYIQEYTGKYFIGKNTLERKFRKLKDIQEQLRAMNIELLPVIEPGKASYFPEYIPDHYHPGKRTLTNQEYFIELFRNLNITYLDLNRYFLDLKNSTLYPLFPNYGMHWSIYGVAVATDSLLKYLGKEHPGKIPGMKIGEVRLSDSLRYSDNDIGNILNLIFPLPKVQAAYPQLHFENDPEKKKLSVLVIADSYYLNIVDRIGNQVFGKQEYWYYNSKVYPAIIDNDNPVYIDKSDLRKKLSEFDVILLMTSEINMHCVYWNFIDEVYQAFHPEYKESHVFEQENRIRNQREWFRFMVAKARKQGLTLEEMIRVDAEYGFYNDYNSIQNKNSEDSIAHIAIDIKNNPEWMKTVKEKARALNVPLEEMIDRDARYQYEQQKKL